MGQALLPRDGARLTIIPPSCADEEYDDMDAEVEAEGGELRPLSHNQLLARVQASMQRKSATAIYRVPPGAKRERDRSSSAAARATPSRG